MICGGMSLQSTVQVCLNRVGNILEDIVFNKRLSTDSGVDSRAEDVVEEVGVNVSDIS